MIQKYKKWDKIIDIENRELVIIAGEINNTYLCLSDDAFGFGVIEFTDQVRKNWSLDEKEYYFYLGRYVVGVYNRNIIKKIDTCKKCLAA